jgi:hypothetical protein
LADSIHSYSEYLKKQCDVTQSNQQKELPIRSIGDNAVIESRTKWVYPLSGHRKAYTLLDAKVKSEGLYVPVLFDGETLLSNPFDSNMQRFRFFADLQLTVPVDIIKYCPGGSVGTSYCIFKVPEKRTVSEQITMGARLLQQIRPQLREYHTKAQRRLFAKQLQNLAKVSPAVTSFIYSHLTLDATETLNSDVRERLRLIFLGNTELIADMRVMNGRKEQFEPYFQVMSRVVEELTAADERRHNIAHMSQLLSISDLMKRTKELCPPETAIPSEFTVQLQFAPKNPYTRRALPFTSKLNVQYKIQRRQLRIDHPDSHFCNAQLAYLKARAVEAKGHSLLLCCDDKAKIPVLCLCLLVSVDESQLHPLIQHL